MSSFQISWSTPLGNPCAKQLAHKAQLEQKVQGSSLTSNTKKRGASSAIVAGTVHSTRRGDPKKHLTVEYRKPNGSHVTTRHVYV